MVRVNSTLPLTRIMQNVLLVCVLSACEAMSARFVMRTGRGAKLREMSNSLGAPKELLISRNFAPRPVRITNLALIASHAERTHTSNTFCMMRVRGSVEFTRTMQNSECDYRRARVCHQQPARAHCI